MTTDGPTSGRRGFDAAVELALETTPRERERPRRVGRLVMGELAQERDEDAPVGAGKGRREPPPVLAEDLAVGARHAGDDPPGSDPARTTCLTWTTCSLLVLLGCAATNGLRPAAPLPPYDWKV